MEKKDDKLVYSGGSIRSDKQIRQKDIDSFHEIDSQELELSREAEQTQESEVATEDIVYLISILSNGYIKPDIRQGSDLAGIRDTKKFFPMIEECFRILLKRFGKTENEVLAILSKIKGTNTHE